MGKLYLNLYRAIPKLVISATFAISFLTLLATPSNSTNYGLKLWTILTDHFQSDITRLVIIVALLYIASSFGFLILNIISAFSSSASSYLTKTFPHNISELRIWTTLFIPCRDLLKPAFSINEKLFYDYFYNYYRAQLYLDETKTDLVKDYLDRIKSIIYDQKISIGFLSELTYHQNTPQDQRKLDIYRDEVEQVQGIWITLLSVALNAVLHYNQSVLIITLFYIALFALLIPLYHSRKSRYIIANINAIFIPLSMGEGQEVNSEPDQFI